MRHLILFILIFFGLQAHAQFTPQQEQWLDKNYITDGGFEYGKTTWVTYKDAAGVAPVDGTGGSPTLTFTVSATTPLAGKLSGIISHPASNVQGEGASFAFTVDPAAKGKVLNISAVYTVFSGTYSGGTATTDSDIEAYIYDVDAAQVIQPAGYKLDGGVSGVPYDLRATFQANISSTNYRLILHSANTTATAFSLKLDNIKVGVGNKAQGPPLTDFIAYNATLTGFGTPTSTDYWYKRVGDTVIIQGRFTTGTVTGTTATVSLPPGMTIDSTKVPSTRILGRSWRSIVSGNSLTTLIGNGGNTTLSFSNNVVSTTGNPFTAVGGSTIAGSGDTLVFFSDPIPISGMASTVTMSDSSDSRIVAARYTLAADVSLTTTPWNYSTAVFDTHAAVTTGASWKFTAPVPGLYQVSVVWDHNTTALQTQLFKNGSLYAVLGQQNGASVPIAGSSVVSMVAGDFIDIRASSSTGTSQGTSTNSIDIIRISGPSQIAASESVVAKYTMASGVSTTTLTPMNYDTKVVDSHSAVTTGVGTWAFRAPVAGSYAVSACLFASASGSTILLYKNGSLLSTNQDTTSSLIGCATQIVPLVAGDTVDIRHNGTVTPSAAAGATVAQTNFISIWRVGN